VAVETFIDSDKIGAIREISVVTGRSPGDNPGTALGLGYRPSAEAAWLLALALEVEAGRLSLDQARDRLRNRGLRIPELAQGPVSPYDDGAPR
jgi:hypothetical protein